MENRDMAQPSTDSMTSNPACFYVDCSDAPKWAVTSMTQVKQPDGKPLILYTCDDHYGTLTNNLRNAGTKYILSPVSVPVVVPSADDPPPAIEEEFEEQLRKAPLIPRLFFKGIIIIAGIIVGPFVLLYYGAKWIFGWRPASEDL